MTETLKSDSEAENKRILDKDKAHGLAIEGDKLETEKVPYKLAKRAIETAFITTETPIEVVNRAIAKDRVNPDAIRRAGEPRVSPTPERGTPRDNMEHARGLLSRMTDVDEPIGAAEHVSEFLENSGISEKIGEFDDKLSAIYEKKPVTDDQKVRAKELGRDPEKMNLL